MRTMVCSSSSFPRSAGRLVTTRARTDSTSLPPTILRVGVAEVGIGFDHATNVVRAAQGQHAVHTAGSGQRCRSSADRGRGRARMPVKTTTWLADLNALRSGFAWGGALRRSQIRAISTRGFCSPCVSAPSGCTRPTTGSATCVGSRAPPRHGGYGLDINSVYPVGQWHGSASLVYGTDVNFPVPFEEGNNPNFNASACDVTTP